MTWVQDLKWFDGRCIPHKCRVYYNRPTSSLRLAKLLQKKFRLTYNPDLYLYKPKPIRVELKREYRVVNL